MKKWNDWTDLMKGNVGQPADPRSKPVTCGPILKKGEVPRRPSDLEIRKAILGSQKDIFGNPIQAQPTNQQLFGHLEVTEEMAKAATEKWENVFNDHFNQLKKPVEKQLAKSDWGNRGRVDQNDISQLTEEERRILAIPVSDSAK